MAKKHPINQLGLDYTSRGNRIVFWSGDQEQLNYSNALFQRYLTEKENNTDFDDSAFVCTSAEPIIEKLGGRLHYPETTYLIKLKNCDPSLKGFSAIHQQEGLLFINDQDENYESRYFSFFLAATLGLYTAYPENQQLYYRAEQTVFNALLPRNDVESFFRETIRTLSPSLALDISDFFKLPFPKITERAYQLRIISEEQYRRFRIVKPGLRKQSRAIFIAQDTKEGNTLESFLFGNDE